MIQGGKIAPRPPMPFFLDMPNHQPTIAPIPTSSTSQPLALTPQSSTSSSELGELKALMQDIGQNFQFQDKKLEDSFSVIQKVSNKVETLERQQAQVNKAPQLQYQAPMTSRPPN